MKKSRTEVDHDSYNCEIGTLAIKSDIQAIDPWLKLSYKKQSYFFQGSAYIIYNDTQKRAQFVSETYSIDYFNNSDYQLIAMITKEGHIYYLKDNMKTKMVSFLHNFNQKRISFFKNAEDFIFISCSKDENKKNSFFNKMEESAKKENIPLSDLFNKIENNLFNNNNIFKKILNADIEEENSEEKNNFENNISEEKEKISLSKNSKKSEDLIFENQKIDINFLNKEEIKIKKSSANTNYKKNYDSKKNNKNKDQSESESEESKSSEKNENIQKYVSLRIFEKFSKEKIFERLNLIKNLKLPKINDCIWNNKNKVFDEIWIPSNSPHKLESFIKTYFYINSEKKNNNKNYSKNQEKRKTRTCTKIIDVDLEKNSQVKSSNKFVSISITNKTNKALNEIRKFENFIGLGEMNNGKNKKAISVAKFSQLPNKIVDLFYNPNDHKRYNDVEFHGSLLSFTFPSTTCGTCSARGHWKENCTFYMQEMVEIHGPHLHCKNIKLKAKPPKKEYWRSKYRGNTPINVVKRQNQSFPTYYCPITKNKKLEKNDLKQFIFSNQKESKQLKNCPDMIDKIEDIFLKHINENKELLLSNKEINEDEIDEAIEFLNEFLDDAIKRGEMSCTFNYKDTIIYTRFKKEYGKKEEKKIDLLTKIYFYTIVNNKDPIYNLSLKISEIKKEIEVLKSKEEDNTNEILLLDDTLKKLENEKKYVKENGKPHLIIGIVPLKEKDSKKTI